MSMKQGLQQAQQLRLLRALDVHFAGWLADETQPALMLAAALTSRHTADGHVCLPLEKLTAECCFGGQHLPLAQQLFASAQATDWQPADWQRYLLACAPVSTGEQATPLKLSQQRLYLHRLWQNECQVAQFFCQQNQPVAVDETAVAALLSRLFPGAPDQQAAGDAQPDWQKVAVAVALTRRIAVISGGPGTGKTTTVAKLLQALMLLHNSEQHNKPLRIRLAAPTGKAAARLSESLGLALQKLHDGQAMTIATTERLPVQTSALSVQTSTLPAQTSALPVQASTLHRLLEMRQDSVQPRFHAGNPLHLDLLVVDEASMIDLPMMARLIEALPPHARLILLGDHDQLASVEAGAILGDICHEANFAYADERREQLTRLTGCVLPAATQERASQLHSSLCLLRKSYRFTAGSGIGQLAAAVNQGNERQLRKLLNIGFADIHQQPLHNAADYQRMCGEVLQGYQHYLQLLRQAAPPSQILAAFSEFQLLCALREGAYGVVGLNGQIERALLARQLIHRASGTLWYHGRPVMINRNDRALGLFNGDTGVTLKYNGEMRVWFALANGELKSVAPGRLPGHETAWCITVHKSQGSEFDHVALVLPEQRSAIISRELIYTAITRAKSKLSLYASTDVLQQAVQCRTERYSGLLERIGS